MNWREIFKRTAFVLIVASLATIYWWGSPPNTFHSLYVAPSVITIALGINLWNMVDRVFNGYYFSHVRWVIFFCFLGGLPLAIYAYKISLLDYFTFCFWASLINFIGIFIVQIFHTRELRRGEIAQYLTPEQAVENLGKPKEIITSDLGTTYFYDKLKIFAPKEGGEIGGGKVVERIPPQLPTSILGFSLEQIVNDLGFPERVINLGSKIIYFYKDMKIIFIDGQVADVQ